MISHTDQSYNRRPAMTYRTTSTITRSIEPIDLTEVTIRPLFKRNLEEIQQLAGYVRAHIEHELRNINLDEVNIDLDLDDDDLAKPLKSHPEAENSKLTLHIAGLSAKMQEALELHTKHFLTIPEVITVLKVNPIDFCHTYFHIRGIVIGDSNASATFNQFVLEVNQLHRSGWLSEYHAENKRIAALAGTEHDTAYTKLVEEAMPRVFQLLENNTDGQGFIHRLLNYHDTPQALKGKKGAKVDGASGLVSSLSASLILFRSDFIFSPDANFSVDNPLMQIKLKAAIFDWIKSNYPSPAKAKADTMLMILIGLHPYNLPLDCKDRDIKHQVLEKLKALKIY